MAPGRRKARLEAERPADPMKIIYLHQYFVTREEKGGTRSYEMGRRLASWGHTVEMVTSDISAERFAGWRSGEMAGMTVHRLSVPYSNSMSYWERIRAFCSFAWRAARKAASLEADAVFASSTPLTIAIPAVRAARRLRVPLVFEVRDLWPELPIAIGALRGRAQIAVAQKLERWAYRNSSRIVALSPGMKEGIARAGYPADRIHVIPNSCDLDLFGAPPAAGARLRESLSWLGGRPLVVYGGTLGRVNGVAYLAKVAASMNTIDRDVRFLVVGDGAELEAVRKTASGLGVLDKNFFMMPAVAKNGMPAVLSAADVATSLFVDLPELWNNSANKFFDALASGTPVAINYRGWQADLLEKNRAGLVLDAKNPQAAAAALARALRDAEWLRQAGEAAARLAADLFARDKLARQLEGVLLSVVMGNSGADRR